MRIYPVEDVRFLDGETVRLRGIASDDLMEEAATGMAAMLTDRLAARPIKPQHIWLLAGPGNNGGDALVIARLLRQAGYHCRCLLLSGGKTLSADCRLNADRLQAVAPDAFVFNDTPTWQADRINTVPDLIIDGLFGSGLNRPLQGCFAQAVNWINSQRAEVVSIDLPSGLFGEDNRRNIPDHIVRADWVLGIRYPRLAFLLPENAAYIGSWSLAPLNVPSQVERLRSTPYCLSEKSDMQSILKIRSTFDHKGCFGHGLLIAGSYEMCGGAILAGMGALRSGIGLLDCCVPSSAWPAVQTALPEAMVRRNKENEQYFCSIAGLPLEKYQAIAIGPALGTGPTQQRGLQALLEAVRARIESGSGPEEKRFPHLLLDADALNLLAGEPGLWDILPEESVLTPHPGELDRLAGHRASSGYERLERARQMAVAHRVFIVLKGAYTAIIRPDGTVSFNATGNPGMATGGSGDVLSGIILSLLSQGYLPDEATRLGVWLHGLSGDLALQQQSVESLKAGDLPLYLGQAFESLKRDIQ